ncbi:hypothetical protein ACWF50_20160 [Brucella pseudogrignonensis]|jgi:hypothetical protein
MPKYSHSSLISFACLLLITTAQADAKPNFTPAKHTQIEISADHISKISPKSYRYSGRVSIRIAGSKITTNLATVVNSKHKITIFTKDFVATASK